MHGQYHEEVCNLNFIILFVWRLTDRLAELKRPATTFDTIRHNILDFLANWSRPIMFLKLNNSGTIIVFHSKKKYSTKVVTKRREFVILFRFGMARRCSAFGKREGVWRGLNRMCSSIVCYRIHTINILNRRPAIVFCITEYSFIARSLKDVFIHIYFIFKISLYALSLQILVFS